MLKDQTVHKERMAGATLRQLAEKHDVSPEAIRLAVVREGRRQIDRIELDLLAATKTGELPAFVVPDHGGPDFDLALEYVRWVVSELEKRDIRISVHYRATHNGVVVALEDISRYGTKENR